MLTYLSYEVVIDDNDTQTVHLSCKERPRINGLYRENSSAPMEVTIDIPGEETLVLHILTGEPERKFQTLASLLAE